MSSFEDKYMDVLQNIEMAIRGDAIFETNLSNSRQ